METFDALVPLDEAYASSPIEDAFDWDLVASELPPGSRVVHGRLPIRPSRRRRRGAPGGLRRSRPYRGGRRRPGFVHYFKGPTSTDGSCLSFCLWDSRSHARSAAGLPGHREAVTLIGEMYARYTLEFLRVSARRRGGRRPDLRAVRRGARHGLTSPSVGGIAPSLTRPVDRAERAADQRPGSSIADVGEKPPAVVQRGRQIAPETGDLAVEEGNPARWTRRAGRVTRGAGRRSPPASPRTGPADPPSRSALRRRAGNRSGS